MLTFAALALGMILARAEVRVPAVVWFSVAAGAGACAVLFRGRGTGAALLVGAVAIGGAAFSARITEPRHDLLACLIERAPADRPLVLTVEGLALDSPRPPVLDSAMARFGSAPPLGSFSLRAERVLTDQGWAACDSVLWCRVPGTSYSSADGLGSFGVRAGQRVRLTGLAEPVRTLENPGQADSRLYAAQAGVAGSLRVESPELISVTSDTARGVRARLAAARDWMHARALRALDPGRGTDPASRALVLSLFLGHSEPGERELRGTFTRLGLAHVLAISGVHVVVMAGVGLFLVRLTGERGALEPIVVALLVVIYLLAVPASAPVVRAGAMTLALLAGEAVGRRYDRLAIIAWCACALVLWRPLDLWSLGFQLSFGLTALLLWLGPRAHDSLFGPIIRGLLPVRRSNAALLARWLWDKFRLALSASLLCWSAALPLIALRTGQVNPLAILTSLITLPAISILMWAGYITLIVGLVWPAAAEALHPALSVCAGVCVLLVERLDQLPLMVLRVPPMSVPWCAAATLLVIAWFSRERRRDRACLVAALVLAVWLAVDWTLARRGTGERIRVDSLAVGEGSCTLLQRADESLLWNAGSTRLHAGTRLIPAVLRELGAWRVSTLVLSGHELGHLSAVHDLVEPLGIKIVLLCGPAAQEAREHPGSGAAWLVADLRLRGIEVRELSSGESIPFAGASILVRESVDDRDARPGRAAPWHGAVRDDDGAPLALLAEDLSASSLERLLGGDEIRGVKVVISGAGPVPRSTGALVIARREEDTTLDSRTLAVARRSAWAIVNRDGVATAGRHAR